MAGISLTQLIPIHELTPGQVGKIRNDAINAVVAKAAKELSLSPDQLVVRDIRPATDLQLDTDAGATGTVDSWLYTATDQATPTYFEISKTSSVMDDQRYIVLFGVRDLRKAFGLASAASESAASVLGCYNLGLIARISLIKITVGGAEKVIWDMESLEAYQDALVAFAPSAVIIPQNASYKIEYYQNYPAAEVDIHIQLVGVVVEPRGKVISP